MKGKPHRQGRWKIVRSNGARPFQKPTEVRTFDLGKLMRNAANRKKGDK